MHSISRIKLDEVEFSIKKKGLWDVVISDNVSYRDIFDIIKNLYERNDRLSTNLKILRNELKQKDEILKLLYNNEHERFKNRENEDVEEK